MKLGATSSFGTIRPIGLRKVLAWDSHAKIVMNGSARQTVGLLYIETFMGIASV